MKDLTHLVMMLVFTWLATVSVAVTGIVTFTFFYGLTDESLVAAVVGMGAALTMGTFSYPAAHEAFGWFEKWYRAK